MAGDGEITSATLQPTADKPLIVRVKRKVSQSPLGALWLEINERPSKRAFSDFQKLSLSESSLKEELKNKKVFLHHVDTVISPEATVDIVQSFIKNPADATANGDAKTRQGLHTLKRNNRQDQLSKSIQNQEEVAKNARFEQISRSRKDKKEAVDELCHFYDVVRVDAEESSSRMQVEEEISLEDQKLLASFLPLLKEHIPIAAAQIQSDMRAYVSEQDEYVYDYYTVNDDEMDLDVNMASNPFPLVQVDDEDFYDVPYESEYDSEDSNAEDNPRNEYPDETSEDEEGEEDEEEDASDESEEGSEQASRDSSDLYSEDEIYCDDDDDGTNHLNHGSSDDDNNKGENWI
ncbi:hypothetical protein CCACVL1_11647 [Corchorus capsularis]|uniref:Uncharacterized protein n=1 Tax=Corchorus capsularis TaxID=210143 RepID=A0A1R3IK70_COCAP|nr:hypothetical protein CCACVL1_11647 [Corchorus capsularis]